jgi:hypothetical protein
MGLYQGLYKLNTTLRKTIVTETTRRGFTVIASPHIHGQIIVELYIKDPHTSEDSIHIPQIPQQKRVPISRASAIFSPSPTHTPPRIPPATHPVLNTSGVYCCFLGDCFENLLPLLRDSLKM